MVTYRVPVYLHREADKSDIPAGRFLHIRTSDRAALRAEVVDWWERNRETGVTLDGDRYYIGAAFPENAEPIGA